MNRFAVVLLLTAMGCGGGEAKKDPVVSETPNEITKQNVTQADLADSKCLGNRVPPNNYLQETSFVSINEPNASEKAKLKAIAGLRDRICQGYRCSELEPSIILWNTQQDAIQVCAMAVVESADVDSFIAAPRASFDQDLKQAAKELEDVLLAAKLKRVSIDSVQDLGIDGGPRAEWLVDRISAALSGTKLQIVRLPKGWDGLKAPKGVDAVLQGRVTQLHGRESMLEVTWKLDMGDQLKTVSPVTFPELIGPVVDTAMNSDFPTSNDKVSLRFDARPGGALCNGQTTEMKLSTTEPLNVRVLDLYGDEALLIWGGQTKVGTPSSLGEFMAMKQEGIPAAEEFVVIAAPQKDDLGVYANAPIPCRIPKSDAAMLHKSQGVPAAAQPYTLSRSYRIMEGPECSKYETPPAASLEGLPTCW